jgi:cysteinyl-tRNA synthetase
VLSIRRHGETRTFAAGEQLSLTDLAGMLRGEHVAAPSAAAPAQQAEQASGEENSTGVTSLREEAGRARAAFDAAVSARDAEGCVSAVLDLEAAIAAWSADTLQSDDVDEARRVLRALVVRLGELAEGGARDPRERVAPYVDLLLELRASARETRDFAMSDLVRDRLVALRVEVRDTPGGSSWELADV